MIIEFSKELMELSVSVEESGDNILRGMTLLFISLPWGMHLELWWEERMWSPLKAQIIAGCWSRLGYL